MEFIFELILQIVFEALAELGIRAMGAPFRRRPNPWLAAVGYGFGSREELLGEAPTYHFATLEELHRAFIC